MPQSLLILGRLIIKNARDMLPLIGVVLCFQYLVIRQPLPDLGQIIFGLLLVVVGLTLFLQGLAMSLFPLGGALAESTLKFASIWLMMTFAFAIGFSSTIAEPALINVTSQAAAVAFTDGGSELVNRNAVILRTLCALAVGLAVMMGCLCIIKGWAATWFVLASYGLVISLAAVTASPLTAIAFDAGSAATSAINVPLISAIAIGLATLTQGRNPLVDGFGVVALCSTMPMLGILLFAAFLW